jgi:hypothetical protein
LLQAEIPTTAKTSETEAVISQANDEKTEAASAVSEESATVTLATVNYPASKKRSSWKHGLG